ncbi:MAG: hypothetical protein R3B47_14270 [Bacteroidia bacterium]
MKSIKQAYFLLIALGLGAGLFGQTDTLVAPAPTSRGDMTARMVSPRTAHGEVLQRKAIPNELGGGTTDIYKLVVEDVFRKNHTPFCQPILMQKPSACALGRQPLLHVHRNGFRGYYRLLPF